MKYHRRQSGSTLVLTAIVALVGFTLAMSLVLMATTSSHMSARKRNNEFAFRIAEAGVHQAVMSLRENNAYSGELNTAFASGAFSVAVSTPTGQPNQRFVSSTGVIPYGLGLSATRNISALIDMYTPPAAASFGIFSKNALTLKGNVSINSWPSVSHGNIGSNTSVSVIGSVTVNGDATSAGTVSTTGAAKITGAVSQHSSPVTFPYLDYNALKAEASAHKVTNGNVTITGSAPVTLTGLINGNLTLNGTGHVSLVSPVYVTGSVSFGQSGPVNGGTLISVGDISASGQSTLTSNQTLVLVTLGNFTLTGGASVAAALYVPNGTFSCKGNSSVNGSVIANTISLSGTPTFTLNTNFHWSNEFAPVHLDYYQE